MPETPQFPEDMTELIAFMQEQQRNCLPGLLGIEILELDRGRCSMRLDVVQKHHAPNGYLHAGTVVALADSAAGYGTVASRPEGAVGFTTLELKCNHIGTVASGGIMAHATLSHGGRTTQVWDAVVSVEETGKTIGLFRNTQLILYP